MSVYVASFLPQPQLGVPYVGYINGVFQGGSTGSITFDVYTGGVGPQGSGTSVTAVQKIAFHGRSNDFEMPMGPGVYANTPAEQYWASRKIVFRSYAETGAPQPPYNAGFAQLKFTTTAIVPGTVARATSTAQLSGTVTAIIKQNTQLSGLFHMQGTFMATTTYQLSGALNLASSTGVVYPPVHLASEAAITSAPASQFCLFLAAMAQMSGAPGWMANSLVGVTDRAVAWGALANELTERLAGNVSVASVVKGWRAVAARLADRITAQGSAIESLHSKVALAAAFDVYARLSGALLQRASSSAIATDAAVELATHVGALVAAWEMSGTTTSHALLFAEIADDAQLADAVSATTQLRMLLEDGMQIGMTLYTGQDTYTAWVMTPQSRAMRSYTNYPFNSYAQIGGQLYGAANGGIYALDGDTDVGAQITASMRTGLLDFGSRQLKRMDVAYIGYAADGTLCMRISGTSPEGEELDYLYRMVPKPAEAPRETRVKFGRGVKSVYWEFVLDNSADGSDFTLYDVVVLPMLLSRRIS